LLAFLGSLHLHDVHAELEELKQARELPEYAKSKRKNHILLRLKRMSPAPDTALRAVVDPDTRSLTSSDADFSRVMSSHWGKVFGRTVTDESLGQKYLSNISDLPEMRTCSLDTVRERLVMHRKISPGPDGILFQCFRSVLDLGSTVLYEVLNTLRDPNGTTPPPNFNEAFLYLLPKKPLSEVDDMPAYGAADTRPLSVCNTDNRLLSGFLRWELEESLNKWICVAQRGFLPNRWMLDNVLDVDCVAQRACLKGSWGALLLFDFHAAFPSLAHDCIFKVLRSIGISQGHLAAIQRLYQNVSHTLVHNGGLYPSFTLLGGVRQGCPLSPLIFVTVLDVFLRRLRHRSPSSLWRAYADDIAVVLQNVRSEWQGLIEEFQTWSLFSGLRLNMPKCVLIPLWCGPGGLENESWLWDAAWKALVYIYISVMLPRL